MYSLRAKEFKIKAREYWIFAIQPVKEATLADAFIEVYTPAQENSVQEADLIPSSLSHSLSIRGEQGSNMQGIGLITRGVIKNLHVNIYHGKNPAVAVTAAEAIISFNDKEAVLKDARIEHKISRKVIFAHNVVWNSQEKAFRIPGPYFAITPKGTAKASGIKVNLDFKVEKL